MSFSQPFLNFCSCVKHTFHMIRKDSSRMQITIQVYFKEKRKGSNITTNIITFYQRGFERRLWWWSVHHRGDLFFLLGILLPWAEKNYKIFHFLKTFEIVIDLLFDTTQGNEVSPGRVAMLIPAEANSKVVVAVVTIIDLFTPYGDSYSGMGSGFWNWR